MSEQTINAAWDEGRQASTENHSLYANPYQENTDEWRAWNGGWWEANDEEAGDDL